MESVLNSRSLFDKYGVAYREEDIIFFEGDYGEDFYVVHYGTIKVVKFINGSMCTIRIMRKGEMFGEFAPYCGNKRTATVIAQSDVGLIRINNKNMYNIINSNTGFAWSFLKILSGKLEYSFELLGIMHLHSLNKKLYKFLSFIINKCKAEVDVNELPVLINEPKDEVEKVIKSWDRMNLVKVVNDNIVSINDIILRNYVESRP